MRSLFGIPLPERKGLKTGGQAVPRKTVIANQPHQLAYINPQEEQMLLDAGGTGQPGPGGIPAYPPNERLRIGANVGGSENISNKKFNSNYRSPSRESSANSTADDRQRAANANAKAAYEKFQASKDSSNDQRRQDRRLELIPHIFTGNNKRPGGRKAPAPFGPRAGERGQANYNGLGKGPFASSPNLQQFPVSTVPSASASASSSASSQDPSNRQQGIMAALEQAIDVPYLNNYENRYPHMGSDAYKQKYKTPDTSVLSKVASDFMNLRGDMFTDLKLGLADSFGGEAGFKKTLKADYPSLSDAQLSSAYAEFVNTTEETKLRDRANDAQAVVDRKEAREGDARDPVTGQRIRDLDFECPEGYTFNEAEQRCEIIASAVAGAGIPTPPGGGFPDLINAGVTTGVPVVNNQYTQFAAPTLAGLPAAAPNGFVMPMMNTQPITIAQQTPQGLAGLQQQIQRNAGMQTG